MPFHLIASNLAVDEGDLRRHFARLRKRDTRAANAAALRAGGLSLRAVAACLGVDEATIRRDLAAGTPVRHPAGWKPDIRPGSSAEIVHPSAASNVIPLRRTAP
jgi:hypothetical protein